MVALPYMNLTLSLSIRWPECSWSIPWFHLEESCAISGKAHGRNRRLSFQQIQGILVFQVPGQQEDIFNPVPYLVHTSSIGNGCEQKAWKAGPVAISLWCWVVQVSFFICRCKMVKWIYLFCFVSLGPRWDWPCCNWPTTVCCSALTISSATLTLLHLVIKAVLLHNSPRQRRG